MDVRIRVKPLELDTKPYGFFMFSMDYLKAARAAAAIEYENRTNFPAYFLYCRSLELAIKSILLQGKRYSLKDVKDVGHNLETGIEKLTQENLLHVPIKFTNKDSRIIADLNKWYKTDQKKFEYYGVLTGIEAFKKKLIEKGEYPDLPNLRDLDDLLNKFVNPKVEKYVLQ